MQKQRRETKTGFVVRNRFFLVVLFIFAVVSDQVSKYVIDSTFQLHETRSLIGNLLYLRYIRNPGIAFGFSLGHPAIMLTLTVLIIILLVYFFIKTDVFSETLPVRIAMVLVLGGAVGNLIDRFRMGEVIDFIDMGIGMHRWPVYNFADIYVTVGMTILIVTYAFRRETGNPHQSSTYDSLNSSLSPDGQRHDSSE